MKSDTKKTTSKENDYQDKVNEKLLADIIHKIKNGLGGIGGFATLLDRDTEPEDPRKRFVRRINDGVLAVNEIAVNLMHLARQKEIEYEKVNMNYFFREILKNNSDEKDPLENRLEFLDGYSQGKVEIVADPVVIEKMLSHSIKFVKRLSGFVDSVQVKPVSKKELLYEIHFHLDSSKKNVNLKNIQKYINEGQPIEARLSLAIVQKMAFTHKGFISIQQSAGKNYTLTVKLQKG